jgi:hypothetical protein
MKNKFKILLMIILLITGSSFLLSCIKWPDINIPFDRGGGITSTASPLNKAYVNTLAATNITDSSATLNGEVYEGDTIQNVSFKYYILDSLGQQGLQMTTSTQVFEGDRLDSVSVKINGLTAGTTYLYYAYASSGTKHIYGMIQSFATNYLSDQIFEGGIKFYVDSTGHHGLIAATNDLSIGILWNDDIYKLVDSTGTSIGTGQANSTAIVSSNPTGHYAARICNDLVLNGYSDWFLPSKDELNLLYKQMYVIGGFNPYAFYWSSSESTWANAWSQFFGDGSQNSNSDKSHTYNVRPIRAF